uniref:gp53-like domain-containing protein n=1 Tax=Citrobacter freundii TaxID=546 RepID=UPI00129C9675|nr:hypothetical protein [Citrobacter freundii]
MSFFASGNNYQYLPNGIIFQWASATAGGSSTTGLANTFPFPFPNGVVSILTGQIEPSYTSAQQPVPIGIATPTNTGFVAKSAAAGSDAFNYLAIGY